MTKIGIGLPGLSIAETRASAQAAAQHEFDSFSVYGDLGDLPPYAVLHASADLLQGSSIKRIGPMGIPAGLQHPAVIGVHAAALEEQLPGQSSLGLVRGAFLDQIGEKPATLDQLRQSVATARQTFEERGLEVPIFLGGFGPKLLAMAGQLAVDGVKLGGTTNPALAASARERIANPDVAVVLGAVSVIDSDRRAARALARYEVAKYLRVVGYFDMTLDPDDTESLAQFTARFDAGDALASSSISDSMLDKFAVAGTPDDAIALLKKMDGVVDCFEFGTPHGLGNRPDAIQYIGDTIVQEMENHHGLRTV